jgi:hypothetical protein
VNVYRLFILCNQNEIYLYCFIYIYIKESKGNKLENCRSCDFRKRPLRKCGTDALSCPFASLLQAAYCFIIFCWRYSPGNVTLSALLMCFHLPGVLSFELHRILY